MPGNPNAQPMSDDALILTVIGVLAAPTLIGLLAAFWSKVVGWALNTGVLVPAAGHPLVTLPQAGGAGLDGPRLAVAVGLLGLLLWLPAAIFRRAWLRRREIR